MNKQDLIQSVRDANSIPNTEARAAVMLLFQEMTNALLNGDRVEIRGFCIFHVKDYKGPTGRNPQTGEKAPIASKRLPFFKCGKELKDEVDRVPSTDSISFEGALNRLMSDLPAQK